jgi:Flp pilus assembly protein TadG
MSAMLRTLFHLVKSLRRSNSGNVAMIFGLALIPVMGMVGAGVDYSRAANVRSRLQAAADAAAVGAISKTSAGFTAAQSMTSDGSIAAGNTAATNIFNADISGKTGFTVTALNVDVERTGQQVTATITFTATVPTEFMQLFGTTTMTVTGTAAAANNLPTYIDFYLLLDNTPSMGIGATPGDISTMVSNTSDQCGFACHDLNDPNNSPAKPPAMPERIEAVLQLRELGRKVIRSPWGTARPLRRSQCHRIITGSITRHGSASTMSCSRRSTARRCCLGKSGGTWALYSANLPNARNARSKKGT